MRISAKADYAVRAVVELASAQQAGDAAEAETGGSGARAHGASGAGTSRPAGKPIKAERLATAQEIPLNFLENILGELRHAGIVRSHRGAEGGFRLAKPADQLTIADIIRAAEWPLASVRGGPPRAAAYRGTPEAPPR